MREIEGNIIIDAVEKLCEESNCILNQDIYEKLKECQLTEKSKLGAEILSDIILNSEIAKQENMPICQDTGMVVIFAEIGQDVHIKGGLFSDFINEGIRRGYKYLRKSVVNDPIMRVNTGDNTPAVIYYDIVEGEGLKISFLPKGFGSENKSRVKMLNPADGVEGIIEFVLETVKLAGGGACPPLVIGIGIGGTLDKAAVMAKHALLRPIGFGNKNEYYKNLECGILESVNNLSIGPQGLGGTTTALAVNIEYFPTHIASIPVCVNISCHVTRHSEVII